ncbi:MAG: hypothetical protein OHK0029_07440 [Armatimonadaceae bacterium]
MRTAPPESADILPDEQGIVYPDSGGMSVFPSLHTLPPHRIPKRLRHLAPEARGSDTFSVWSMDEGAFTDGKLTEKLALRPDPTAPAEHGFVEPGTEMALIEYRQALAETRSLWKVDETGL